MEFRSILASFVILGALIGIIVFGGPLFLSTLAIIAFLAIRQWSQTIKPLDRSAINIITIVNGVYLAEVYLTTGPGPSVLILPFLALATLFGWYYYTKQTEILSIVSESMVMFLLIPYSFGFIVLLRDLPDSVGTWTAIAVAAVSTTMSAGVWLTQKTKPWLRAIGLILISALTVYFLLRQPLFVSDMKTLAMGSIGLSMVGYFGCLLYMSLRKILGVDWLMTVFVASFVGPTLYIMLTFLS